MHKFLSFIFRQRMLVIFGTIGLIVGGIFSWRDLPIDAFPDVTNVQVMILTEAPGFAPTEVERLISFPIEISMNGLPDIQLIRSLSKAGLSQVVIIFEDWVDIYFARQLVFERLTEAREHLPPGLEPELGPISTGLGEIYQYTLQSINPDIDLTELRTIQDWIIKLQLQALPGVTEVNSFGGFVKQYHVIVDPDMLLKYDIALDEVTSALINNNANASGSYIYKGGEQIIVRGIGLIESIEDIENIVITSREEVPLSIKDIAEVEIGHEVRQGTVTRDGEGEVVCGMTIMLKDANAKQVVERVKEKIAAIKDRLPEGVSLDVFYDRMDLIKECIATVSHALLLGGFLVIVILFLFLGSFRTAGVVCLSLPLSALFCFIIMRMTGLSANLMSLGGLAVAMGMIVDANIVIAENIHRHLSERGVRGRERIPVCINAVAEVAKPVTIAILIIIVVFIPLFSLQAVEGKMFRPLALTLMYVMAGSLLVALTITPVLGSIFIRAEKTTRDNFAIRIIQKGYLRLLDKVLEHKKKTAFIAALIFCISLFLFKFVGTEFMPYLDEGSIAINVVKFPTASLEESKRIGIKIEKLLLEFPEVKTVVSKTGRAEISEDPMGPEQSDSFIMLQPKSQWRFPSKAALIKAFEEKLSILPGLKLNFTQPIALRVNELISGIKSDIAIKIFGYDLDILKEKAEEIEHAIAGIRGAEDVKVEQISGLLQLDIDIDRQAIARCGINVADVNDVVETAIGGKVVSTMYEGDRRFAIFVRFPERKRKGIQDIGNILVSNPNGVKIPLAQLATITEGEFPAQISRENSMRRVVIECNVRGRDIGSFVAEAQGKIQPIEATLPHDYFITWGGQFENQQRAMRTLSIIVPLVVLIIFVMLFSAFGSVKPALLVILNLPFSLIGGIFFVFLFKITLSVSAVIGFIALFGVAVENATVLVSFFIQLRRQGLTINEAIRQGCALRLRPLLLTTLTTMFGLLPLLWATGAGAEIQKPLAVVVIGGLISSWCLTLIVLPALYGWFEKEVVEF
ncbi:MAG: CusA/CzcA family heavy metal efflux RND transporter [Candidatus Tritonobacter lacicola]|nr:CusA/CzcA family heavy metal efflux RND transporter [Candidatus Tritonobacter lacicola]